MILCPRPPCLLTALWQLHAVVPVLHAGDAPGEDYVLHRPGQIGCPIAGSSGPGTLFSSTRPPPEWSPWSAAGSAYIVCGGGY